MEKKALGRGLEALLPVGSDRQVPERHGVIHVSLEHILPNRYQPRRDFPEVELNKLAESVKQAGLLQPVVVRRKGDGFYELIAGERRWRAAKLAGLESIPAIVKNCSDEHTMVLALVENLQRQDLNPMETSKAYHRMLQEFGMTQEHIAQWVGKDRSSVANVARLVNLPFEIHDLVQSGKISSGHAKVILGLKRPEEQVRLARRIVERQLSVRGAEMVVESQVRHKRRPARGLSDRPYRDLEEKVQKLLGTKVTIKQKRRRGGEIVIHFFSQSELDRIIEVVLSSRRVGNRS